MKDIGEVCAGAGFVEERNARTALTWFRCYESAVRDGLRNTKRLGLNVDSNERDLIEANHRTILAEQRLARLTGEGEP